MRFHILFICSCIALQWAPSSVAYAAEPDVLNTRQRELRKMLIPSCHPPSFEWIATNHMERFGVSIREFTQDLQSIAFDEQEEHQIRVHAFSQFSYFATDAEILELPCYFDGGFDKDLRGAFISRALGGIDSVEDKLSFAKRLVAAEEQSEILAGDQFCILGYFGRLVSYSKPAPDDLNRIFSFYRDQIASSTNIFTIWSADTFLCRKDPNYRYSAQRVQSIPGWLALTNQIPERDAANGCKYFEEAARDLESHLNDANAPESVKSEKGGTKPPSGQPSSLSVESSPGPTDSDSPLPQAPAKQNRWVVVGFTLFVLGFCAIAARRQRKREKASKR